MPSNVSKDRLEPSKWSLWLHAAVLFLSEVPWSLTVDVMSFTGCAWVSLMDLTTFELHLLARTCTQTYQQEEACMLKWALGDLASQLSSPNCVFVASKICCCTRVYGSKVLRGKVCGGQIKSSNLGFLRPVNDIIELLLSESAKRCWHSSKALANLFWAHYWDSWSCRLFCCWGGA